jgi:hypothetical protein
MKTHLFSSCLTTIAVVSLVCMSPSVSAAERKVLHRRPLNSRLQTRHS